MVRAVTDLNELELNALITDLVQQKDNAYAERNKCVVLIESLLADKTSRM